MTNERVLREYAENIQSKIEQLALAVGGPEFDVTFANPGHPNVNAESDLRIAGPAPVVVSLKEIRLGRRCS
jgi:hypothetical protein